MPSAPPTISSQLLPSSQYTPLVTIQVLTAGISIVTSVVVLRISSGKLLSAYQRLVLTLTIAIVLISATLILQPFLVPLPPPTWPSPNTVNTDTSHYWSSGNSASCSSVGFLQVLSTTSLGFYSVMLALYFYFSIQADRPRQIKHSSTSNSTNRHPKQPEDVIGCPERMGHIFCWIAPAALAGTGIGLDQYRLDASINMCILSEGGILREVYQWTLFGSIILSIAVALIIQLQVRDGLRKIAAITNLHSNMGGGRDLNRRNVDNNNNNNNDVDHEQQEMIKQKFSAVAIQCALYTSACSACSVFYLALLFLPKDNQNLIYSFQILTACFYPFLGVVNCIIYVRPRVQMLQIMYPEDPYIAILRVGMSTAGDADEIEQIRARVFGSEYIPPSGSQIIVHEQDEVSDEVESLGEIPSFVHLDANQPLSINSLVSIPGENDNDDGDGGNNNKRRDDTTSPVSPIADPQEYDVTEDRGQG